MSTADIANLERRRFLTYTAIGVGGIGTLFAAIPFIKSWSPSERAEAAGAPVEIDISKLEPGALLRVEWRSNPVLIVSRPKAAVDALASVKDELRDPDSAEPQQPDYVKNDHRSIKPELLVLLGNCTHLGCIPTYRPEVAPADLGPQWKGGFFCPCHGSKFDLAGRVYKGVPAPLNLVVPPYKYLSDSRILIGENPETA